MKTSKGEKTKLKENRTLNISNYRNIGVYANDKSPDDRTFLKVNRSLERDEIGGLVILLGLNNSGKSNVLDALEAASNGKITESDVPDFLFRSVQPKLQFNIANGSLPIITGKNKDHIISLIETPVTRDFLERIDPTNPGSLKHLSNYLQLIDVWIGSNSTVSWNDDKISVGYNSVKYRPVIEWTNEFLDDQIMQYFGQILEKDDWDSLKEFWNRSDYSVPSFESEYGYVLGNRVIRYNDVPIRQSDLECPGLSPNAFFTDLFRKMDVDIDVVKRLFQENYHGMKEKFESEFCEELMDTISDDFNRMLASDPENGYRFRLDVGESKLHFVITRGNIPLNNLDRQSDGFRWIFDFYMNFIMKNTLAPGDIVLMDEFGYKLNPKTIKDISALMRRIGRDEGVTFVIATQNFMIVDTGHLDENRLVVNESNGNTKIFNEFDRFTEGHDVLEPLLSAMTISRNLLRTENRRTVFVEGMSDYFFLTAMIHYLRDSGEDVDIDIVPMNGLGKNSSGMRETISSLRKIERNPMVLVDGDGAGKRFSKESVGKDITVLDLSEIMDGNVTVIEDMFTKEERDRFHLDNKEFDVNACFAQNYMENIGSLSEETIGRFRKLIENIMVG